ncbi:glycosyltransferase [Candidatus Pelagibacter sp.]|nr:glycosyltransferase [Candidatus Pelagibacter sp.]
MKIYHTKNNINILNLKKTKDILKLNYKTLIISNNSKYSWANAVNALKEIKFKKRKFIYPTNEKKLSFSIFTKILLKFKIFYDQFRINERMLYEIKKNKFQKIIIVQPFNIYGSTLKEIKKKYKNIEIIALFIDPFLHNNYFTLNLIFSLQYFDKIIYRQPYNERFLQYLNSNFKIRCFPGINIIKKKIKKIKYKYDVSFIGTYENERYRLLSYLSKNGIKVTIFGNGWENINSTKYLIIKKKPIYGKEFYKTILSSKINISFLRRDNKDVYNSKTVEILAAGGFMLSQHSKFIEKIFKDKKDLIFFKVDNEINLLNKVKFYLDNSKLREKIKKNSLKKVNSGLFNYSSQLSKIIDLKI